MNDINSSIVKLIFLFLTITFLRLLFPKFAHYFKLLKIRIKKTYKLNLSQPKQEQLVWEDLINLHKKENWNYTIHENTKCLESIISVDENTLNSYFYMFHQNKFQCSVKVLYDFPEEITTEIFILTTHINNILNDGIISINLDKNYVDYSKKEHILVPLLVPNQLRNQIVLHYDASVKIQWAFNELKENREEAVIVFADLMKKLNQTENYN